MGIASRTKGTSRNIVIILAERDTTNILEIYHLKGASNYGVMCKHTVSKDGLFTYFVTLLSSPMIATKVTTRFRILSYFHSIPRIIS
jgi:hypothetical protein